MSGEPRALQIDVGRAHRPLRLCGDEQGAGPPVVLVHGWPNSAFAWERQVPALAGAGRRVIRFDRRGFGRSARPDDGYDVDTLAEDLHRVLQALDLQACALVGFGMGCREIVRLLGTYGDERVCSVVLVGAVQVLQPPGGDGDPVTAACEQLLHALHADPAACLQQVVDDGFRPGDAAPLGSPDLRHRHWQDAIANAPHALAACIAGWRADLGDDLRRIGVPTLVLHGGADRLLPAAHAARSLADGIAGARLQAVDGAPHALTWTHADTVNATLDAFLA